ncbi:hypothetical protein ASC80_10025 [Afipia sp. Root123D2]|nr:hypothetical protein ASC80_10025 [Afipia sp. Root123D2]
MAMRSAESFQRKTDASHKAISDSGANQRPIWALIREAFRSGARRATRSPPLIGADLWRKEGCRQ